MDWGERRPMSEIVNDNAEILTVNEAAEFLRIGRNQLYDAIGRGEVPHKRIGRSIRLSRTALVAWLGGGLPSRGSLQVAGNGK